MRCYVLSLHRCGTQSTAQLLRLLGLKTIHWPARHRGIDLQATIEGRETDLEFVEQALAPVLDRFESVADVPMPALYRQLHRRDPEAKFVLLRRDEAAWVRSVRGFVGERELAPFERTVYWHYFPERPRGIAELSDQELAAMHRRHTDEAVSYFAALGSESLLVERLESASCGKAISTFLGYLDGPALPTYAAGPQPSRLSTAVAGKLRRTRAALNRIGWEPKRQAARG